MNLDKLVNSIPNSEPNPKESLFKWVNEWKHNTLGVSNLEYLIGKWHGNVWFKDANVSNKFYKEFVEFRDKGIRAVNGMTLNERLYLFSLFDLWDSNNPDVQNIIRKKLEANP